MSARYSLKSALAATRGARTATRRAERRYRRQPDVETCVLRALVALNEAERLLRLAAHHAIARAERRRAA